MSLKNRWLDEKEHITELFLTEYKNTFTSILGGEVSLTIGNEDNDATYSVSYPALSFCIRGASMNSAKFSLIILPRCCGLVTFCKDDVVFWDEGDPKLSRKKSAYDLTIKFAEKVSHYLGYSGMTTSIGLKENTEQIYEVFKENGYEDSFSFHNRRSDRKVAILSKEIIYEEDK